MRLYLRFALLAGIALAIAGAAGLWFGRGHATHRAQLAVWRDAAFMAERLGRDDLARTALTHPAVGDQQTLLDDLFGKAAVAPGIVRVTLLRPDGTVTYSSVHDLIGGPGEEPKLLREALENGRSWAVSTAAGHRVLVSYVPVHWLFSPDGSPSGALAVYRDYAPVAKEIGDDERTQAAATALALLLLYAALFPILRGVTRALAERNRRLAQQAAELERLASIVESSSDAIVGSTVEGTITSWNAAAEAIYGWTAEEALGQRVSLLVPPDRADLAERSLAAIGAGRSVVDHHAVHVRNDGAPFDVAVTISPVLDASGRVTGGSMVARDVTDRLDLERRLRRTQRSEAVGRLAGGVAHDFNNLLTGIGSYADLAARDLPPESEARWHVEEIRKATARGAALTGQLLDFEGRREMRPQVVDLNAIVARTLPLLRRVIGEDVDLSVDAGGGLLRVLADPAQLEQLVVTLVLNARDAGAAGGAISLETAASGGSAVLTVHDGGAGGARRHGLELAALWELVQGSGGTVEVEAEPGGGTCVRVSLPLAEGPVEQPAAPAPAPEPAPSARQATVLLVEDEEIVRAVVREVLEDAGHTVVAAHHGRQALELCEAHEGRVDVLVTDVVMPELGGIELAERVRELHPDVAVVLMSGYPDREVSLDGTPTRWLQKPFSHGELTAEVDAALAAAPLAAA